MTIFYSPVESIESTIVSVADTSTIFDQSLHGSHMTFLSGQMKGCGLLLVLGINVRASLEINQSFDDPGMTFRSCTV